MKLVFVQLFLGYELEEGCFFDGIQRSFYLGYFGGHGMKLQALTLKNGMFGSVYIGPLRVSDTGLMKMTCLDTQPS